MNGIGNIQQVTPVAASTTETGKIVEDTTTGTPKVTQCGGAGVNVFSAWITHDASLAVDSWLCMLILTSVTTALDRDVVIEVGKGSAGSEVTIIRISFCWGFRTDAGQRPPVPFSLPIPIKVLAGERLAIRAACGAAAKSFRVGIQYYQGMET